MIETRRIHDPVRSVRSAVASTSGQCHEARARLELLMLGGERAFSGFSFKGTGSGSIVAVVLACWGAALLAFAALPEDSGSVRILVDGVCWAAQAFTAIALTIAFLRSEERMFWALLGGAVLGRYAGDLVWMGFGGFGVEVAPTHQTLAGLLSYPLFIGALLRLVQRSRRELTFVDMLDSMSAILSSGLLIWHFLLSPASVPANLQGLEAFANIAQPAGDFGLFLLALGILAATRTPFMAFLTGGFLLFLAADGAYLALRTSQSFVSSDGPALLWTGGVTLLGIAALRRAGEEPLDQEEKEPGPGNFRTLLFWLGPLSPSLQYGALLVWEVFHPPVQRYVLFSGAALLGVIAVRTYVANHAGVLISRRRELSARESEQYRIMSELHDTVKQNVRGTSMLIEACSEAQKKGDSGYAQDLLNQALEMAREAGHQLSRPLGELRLCCQDQAATPFFKEHFEEFGRRFGLQTHEDLQAPLETLSRQEIAAAHRVYSEALWNAVNHAQASNLWLESRRIGSVFVLKVRDDGRGFRPEEARGGLGLSLMRSRAGEVGANLDLISDPGRGTTVQLRFDKK